MELLTQTLQRLGRMHLSEEDWEYVEDCSCGVNERDIESVQVEE